MWHDLTIGKRELELPQNHQSWVEIKSLGCQLSGSHRPTHTLLCGCPAVSIAHLTKLSALRELTSQKMTVISRIEIGFC